MKTIIACTDFSPSAQNAVQYAAALAQHTGARLLLFHHYDYPIPATDMPGVYPTVYLEEMVTDLERQLQAIQTDLERSYKIQVSGVTRALAFSTDLEHVFRNEAASLVVMGMHGRSAIMNVLMGNITATSVRRGKMPIMVIPAGVVFHPIEKILFPYDRREILNPKSMAALQILAKAFNAYIEVLTLFDLKKTPELVPEQTAAGGAESLDALLKNVRHGYSYENEAAIDKGILYEAVRSNADLVAMIPHHHSFFSALLGKSETQRVATRLTLPLLALGEMLE